VGGGREEGLEGVRSGETRIRRAGGGAASVLGMGTTGRRGASGRSAGRTTLADTAGESNTWAVRSAAKDRGASEAGAGEGDR
jgi:hypothetical protein